MPHYDDEYEAPKPKEPAEPVEPVGAELTRRRRHNADTKARMQKVADEINAHLRGYVVHYITEKDYERIRTP